jgi:hypothetical protein
LEKKVQSRKFRGRSPFPKGRERGILKSFNKNKISPHPSLRKRGNNYIELGFV